MRAFAYVGAFIFAQLLGGVVAAGFVAATFGSDTISDVSFDDLSVPTVTLLLCAEAVVAATAFVLAYTGPGMRATGLRATTAETLHSARLIAPVSFLIVVPVLALRGDASLIDPDLTPQVALLLIVFALVIGFAEELFFRGLIVDVLGGPKLPWLAAGGSSLLFGLPHMLPNGEGGTAAALLNAAAVTLVVGVPFALVRLRTNALWPLVIAHGLIDIAAFLHTASISATGSPSAGDVVGTLLASSAVAGAYCIWYWRTSPPRSKWVYG